MPARPAPTRPVAARAAATRAAPALGLALGLALVAAALAALAACAAAPDAGRDGGRGTAPAWPPTLVEQGSGTSQLIQAVSVVDADVVWVSGHGGTFARTTDGGATWRAGRVPGADTLQFRDVHARDARTAWLLSAGPGDMSRIFRTDDGGASWAEQWVNPEPEGFYDCLDFWDDRRGVVYGDAVDGALRILRTEDGGASWRRVPSSALPPALPGEGGFAASGLCVQTGDAGRGWIAAGNTDVARVFITDDHGASWRAAPTPVVAGEGAGLTAISMIDARRGYVFGGDIGEPDARADAVARTDDGGASWRLLPRLPFTGAAYGGLAVPGTDGAVLVAVGPRGAAVSLDAGGSWSMIDDRSWWAVGSAGTAATWVTGPEGRIARLDW